DHLTYGPKRTNLHELIDQELTNLARFDAKVASLQDALEEEGYSTLLNVLDGANKDLADFLTKLKEKGTDPDGDDIDPDTKQILEGKKQGIKDLQDKRGEILAKLRPCIASLKGHWKELEESHRVLPVRMPPEPVRGVVVNWQDLAADCLLSTE